MTTEEALARWDTAARRVRVAGEAWRRMHDLMKQHSHYYDDPPHPEVAAMRVRANLVWAEYLRRGHEEYEPARLAYDDAVCAERGITRAQLDAEQSAFAARVIAELDAE